MKIEKINVVSQEYDYNNRLYVEKITEQELVTEEGINEFKAKLEALATSLIIPNKTIIFDKSVTFPRSKFKTAFPDNKMVRDLEKADIIVIDKAKTKLAFNYFYFQDYHLRSDGNYTTNIQDTKIIQKKVKRLTWRISDHQLKTMEFLSSIEGKIIIDVKDINISNDNVLDAAAMKKISQMFSSKQNDLINMGIRLLTAFDYKKDRVKIVCLLNNHSNEWRRSNKKINVEVKTLLNKLSTDFPGWDREDALGKMQFWFKIVLEDAENEIAQNNVKELVKLYMPQLPEFKIIRDENMDKA